MKELLLALTFGLFPLLAEAATLSASKAAALRQRFEARQKETRSWTSSFTQTLVMSGLRDPVVSEGTISYRAPGDLRIAFTKPEGESVLILGDRLLLQKSGKRLTEKSLSGDTAGKPFLSLLGLLQGRPSESEEQYTPQVAQDGGAYTIVLTKKPEAGNRLPKRIVTTLDDDTLDIRGVTVELPNGGTLTYAFRGTARNRPVDAALFAVPTSSP